MITVKEIMHTMKKGPFDIADLPEAIYHAVPAMSASGLKSFRKSPGDWKWNRENPSEDTTARRWGRLVHLFLSQPHRIETDIEVIDGHRGGKEVKAAVEAAQAAGKTVVKSDEFNRAAAIRKYAQEHPILGLALKQGIGERSFFWLDPATGAPCRARIDWITKDIPWDWKTFDNVHSEDALEGQIRKEFYDYQDVWHREAFLQVYGRPVKDFYHAFIQEDPIKIQITRVTDTSREEIAPYIRGHLAEFAECLKTDTWPLNDGEIKDIVVKPWRS